jgi:hypothetical protein
MNSSAQKRPSTNRCGLCRTTLDHFSVLIVVQTVASILETLRAPRPSGTFTPEDKLRLVLVFYLSSPDNAISKDDVAELEKELKKAGANTEAFEYVRRTREISRMTVSTTVGGTSTPTLGTGQGELFRGFTAFGSRVSTDFTLRIDSDFSTI